MMMTDMDDDTLFGLCDVCAAVREVQNLSSVALYFVDGPPDMGIVALKRGNKSPHHKIIHCNDNHECEYQAMEMANGVERKHLAMKLH